MRDGIDREGKRLAVDKDRTCHGSLESKRHLPNCLVRALSTSAYLTPAKGLEKILSEPTTRTTGPLKTVATGNGARRIYRDQIPEGSAPAATIWLGMA